MGIIRLFTITTNNIGSQFILKEYPELRLYESLARRQDIKHLNIEQYFRGVKRNYKDYTKLVYGPVYGEQDRRNGFIYEHNTSGEMIIVDENDIPVTHETGDVLMADVAGIVKTDTNNIDRRVITSYNDMINLSSKLSDPEQYNDLIRDSWILNKSFLTID